MVATISLYLKAILAPVEFFEVVLSAIEGRFLMRHRSARMVVKLAILIII
jgi:hypothetical protein